MRKQTNILILLVGFILGTTVSVCTTVLAEKEAPISLQSEDIQSLPFDELRTFTEIFGRIKQDYVEPVSDKKLLEDAIRGMLTGLDPHSAYLADEEYKELQEGTTPFGHTRFQQPGRPGYRSGHGKRFCQSRFTD
jgi:carboxyl-terminal processing protease